MIKKLLNWLFLNKIKKERAKRLEKIESLTLSIKGLTDINHAHHI